MRVLTEQEMSQLERWARETQIAKMLNFIDTLPRFFHVSREVLLGSNNKDEILILGDKTTSEVRGILANLDEPFNPHLEYQITKVGKKRDKPKNSLPYFYQEFQKGLDQVCLLKGSDPCSQKIVRAHSIQKALFKDHAKNGHVYHFDPINGPRDANKMLWPDLVGINKVTTFTGFCEHHDARVFSAIETCPFQNSAEQQFLFHYRAFSHSYYGWAHKFKPFESAIARLSCESSAESMKSLLTTVKINQHDVIELQSKKSAYDSQLLRKDWSAIEARTFVGEVFPDVLATGFFAPSKDFQGRLIQNTKILAPLQWVSLTITASNNKALFILCGDKNSIVLRNLIESFHKVPPALQTTVLITYVFCRFDNFILLPRWWDSLSKETQLKFACAAEAHYFRRELPNTCDWKLKEMPT